jgi:hypothetical protein
MVKMTGSLPAQFLLAQDPLESIQKRFTEGGSLAAALGVLALIVLFLVVLALLQRMQTKRRPESVANDPRKLFNTILRRLDLTVVQRDQARRMVRELRLEHPTFVLLGPEIFRRHAEAWRVKCRESAGRRPPSEKDLAALFEAIFGEPLAPSKPNIKTSGPLIVIGEKRPPL